MAKLKLISTIFSKLNTLSKSEGQVVVSKDSKSLYVDLNDERIEITDWIDVDTEENLLAILSPLINKYYYTKDTNKIWRYINSEWICINDSSGNNTTYGVATSSTLGLVKSGTDITVDSSGNVSVNDDSHNHTINNVDGLQTALDEKASSSHTHSYLPLSGGTVTGTVKFSVPPRIYNGEYYVILKPIDGVNGNRTLYTPNRSSVAVTIPYSSSAGAGTAVGDTQRPVYVNQNGYASECSELMANTNLKFNNYAGFIKNTGKQYMHIHASNEDNYGFVYGANRNSVWAITPYSGSHKQYLGTSSYKWETVYAANGAIQTSDRNAKHDIKPLDDKYIELFKKLIPVSFVFNSNTSGRTHIGFISQDVEEAMLEVGLSDLDFAGFCKDVKTEPIFDEEGEWMEERPVYDADGNPEYIYSLRYDEFIAIVTRMVQIHDDRLNDIEKRLVLLEEQ